MTQPANDALRQRFFEGMSHVAATVNVVTTDGQAGRAGVTVSAMSSVSADTPKPTLLICINENSVAADVILKNGVFCVNILQDHQTRISDVFAGRFKDQFPDKFTCGDWQKTALGSPRVAGALVAFDCKIVSSQKFGTHHVIFGEVHGLEIAKRGSALIYSNRSYGSSQPIEVTALGDDGTGNSISIGCFHSFAPFIVPAIVKKLNDEGEATAINILEGENRRLNEALLNGEIDFALLYDYGLSEKLEKQQIAQLTPYVLLAYDHPLAKKKVLEPEDLEGQPMISVSEKSSAVRLEAVLRDKGIEPQVVFRSSTFEMTRGMVAQGLGFAIVMTMPATATSYDGRKVAALALAVEEKPSRVVIAYREKSNLPAVLEHAVRSAAGQLEGKK